MYGETEFLTALYLATYFGAFYIMQFFLVGSITFFLDIIKRLD
jgi:hypothetical protein